MKISEIILLGGLSVFSGSLLWGSLDMPYSTDTTFGPGFIPLNISIALLALVGVVAVRAVLRSKRGFVAPQDTAAHGGDGGENSGVETLGAFMLGGAIVAIAISIYAMSYIGVLIPLGFLLVVLSWQFSGHGLLKSVVISLIVLAAIYLIFSIWLRIPLH
ncbi:tripartite tricarboxylate transporter TctB family protein [Thalassospira marina]|uniref:DUF1468 domain-containing protein n=1 Tax=Thalassospira marina TaxID=2048283 RepID=A0A2N3KES1_9PROT|nr:tripartite tricarboxylate transporter TctB family protein [Thalassospira marina]AUG55320.1 hypothetical protein CSC3H3_20805 [Thalassospira marina]PKR49065.1 hypothetical protein COO20_23165 [Thalassospira marina]